MMVDPRRAKLDLRVRTDVHCIACGYCLRGAERGGRCPECGSLVRLSLRPRPKRVPVMVWVTAGVSGLFAVIHGIGVLAASSGPGAISFVFALWFIAPLIVLGATAFIARGMIVLGLITLLAVAIGIFDFVLLAQVPRDAQGGLVVLFGPVWEWPFVALALLVAVVSRVWSSRRSAYS